MIIQVQLLAKVPFHPMAKVFSLFERIFSVLQFTLVEIPKGVFYYTSCQPNWFLLAKHIFGTNQVGKQVNIITSDNVDILDTVFIQPTFNCDVLGRIALLFNTAVLVFFFMTCALRFYLIVVKQANTHQETLTRPVQIVSFTLLGIIVTMGLFVLTLDDQYTFSQACLAPDEEQPLPKLSKKLYYSIVGAVNFLVVILYITITIKVKAYPQVNLKEIPWHGATNSRHFCTVSAVCTLYQSVIICVVVFLGSPYLWKLVSGANKYTNMAHVRPDCTKTIQLLNCFFLLNC